MPAPELLRPTKDDWWDALQSYLVEHFRRAKEGRDRNVQEDYDNWRKIYDAEPAEKIRKVPFYKASNFVVPITRMFIDTDCAHTLGMIWATNPLISVTGFPNDAREGGEEYLNRKARYEWEYYKLLRAFKMGGSKYGTAIVKIGWETREVEAVTDIAGGITSEPVTTYEGPWAKVVPFEDFFCYPVNADELEDMVVTYHLRRFPEEQARRLRKDMNSRAAKKAGRPIWDISEEELEKALKMIEEAKRERQNAAAGIDTPQYREFQAVECELEWEISGRHYPVVAILQPDIGKLMDVYFRELPPGCDRYVDYRPHQRDGLFWGDSDARILAQSQEEISRIHNERRDAAALTNGPQFLKKRGTPGVGPRSEMYPGKVHEVDEIDDFKAIEWGGRLPDTMAEEQFGFQIAEKLKGIDGNLQGMSQGQQNKRGVYNTGGVLAMMGQANSRQMTHIRDFRWSVSRIVKAQATLQRIFGPNDPTIEMFDAPVQEKIRRFLELATPDRVQRSFFELKASDPTSNKEIDKQNLLQMAGILSQSSQQLLQLVGQYQMVKDKNPLMARLIEMTLEAQHDMAVSVARAFDQLHLEGKLPHFKRLLDEQRNQAAAQQGVQSAGANGRPMGEPGAGGLQQILAGLRGVGPSIQ